MELQLSHESICLNEVVFDGTLEQSIELDYLLPDYCSSVFKILKCRILPKVTSERISGGKLMIDGVALIKVLYVTEENYQIRSVTQKQVFSKSVELKENYENSTVRTSIQCDYTNCRVVNPRRLDIRGAVTIKASVSAVRQLEILSGASGMGVQVCNKNVTALDRKLSAGKEFTIKEEVELAYGKPSIAEILDHTASASLTDYKIIANKVVLKGEILLHTLYLPEGENTGPEIMDCTLPISQIMDLPGITEEYQCMVSFCVNSADLFLHSSDEEGCKGFDAEFTLRACCEADKNAQTALINDAYSTGYELQSNSSQVKIEHLLSIVQESCICKQTVRLPQEEFSCIYDIGCEFTNENCKLESGILTLTGNLEISVLARDSDNMPILFEKSEPCEVQIDLHCDEKDLLFSPRITVTSVSYSLISANEVEVRAEIKICGNLYQYQFYDIVQSISIDENGKKKRRADAVLQLYFAAGGESVWEIAKRFNTSVDSILSENNLDGEYLANAGMILIPMID